MRSDRGARRRSEIAALALVAVGLAFASCARTVAERSVVEDKADDEQGFWNELETRRVVTNHDALHGLFLAADGADPNPTYEDRLFAARERGWIGDDFQPDTRPANQSATVGDLAVVACRVAGIKGGLTMRVFGPSPRYATRELVYMGVLPDRSDSQSMSGLEFIDFVSRVQDRALIASGELPKAMPEAPGDQAGEAGAAQDPARQVERPRDVVPENPPPAPETPPPSAPPEAGATGG